MYHHRLTSHTLYSSEPKDARKAAESEYPAAENPAPPPQTERQAVFWLPLPTANGASIQVHETSGIRAVSTGSELKTEPSLQATSSEHVPGASLPRTGPTFLSDCGLTCRVICRGQYIQTQTYACGWKTSEEIQKCAQLWKSLPALSSPPTCPPQLQVSAIANIPRPVHLCPTLPLLIPAATRSSRRSCPCILHTDSVR